MDRKIPNSPQEYEKEIKARKAALWPQLIEIGFDFAAYIAAPLLIFIYGGKWLDARYNTHFFVIIGILLALALSCLLIYRKIKTIKNLMDK